MFLKLTAASSSAADRKAAAAEIVAAVNKDGPSKVLKVYRRPLNPPQCGFMHVSDHYSTVLVITHPQGLAYHLANHLRRSDCPGCR